MKSNPMTVLILDDEYLVRELLKRSINWDALGITIAAEASSAMEALDLVEEVHPDIIFADICMPVMDGIEFSKRVLAKYPQVKIIILTGHDEFEYAKKSIALGITDFLLKPIDAEEIHRVLGRVRKKVEEEKLFECEYRWLKHQIEENFPYLKEKLYNDLLLGSFSEPEIVEKLSYYGIEFSSSHYQIAVLEPSYSSRFGKKGEEDFLMLRLHCREIIQKYFADGKNLFSFLGPRGNIVLLSNNPEIVLVEYCDTIKNNLINRLNCSLCIGIGNKKETLPGISLSYEEAHTALGYKVIEGKNTVIAFSDVDLSDKEGSVVRAEQLVDLNFYLRAGIRDKICAIIDAILDEYQHQGAAAIQSIRVSASNIISVYLNITIEAKIASEAIFQYGKQPYDCVFTIETLPEMKTYLKKLAELLVKAVHSIQSKKTCQLVKNVITYLQENYHCVDLTQNVVAEEFHVNSSYLSRKFKQETEQTFIDYLSRLRIEKAIELFKETDKKNYEVAEDVGIADPHYFSVFFKRHMNMSISEYRKMLQQS